MTGEREDEGAAAREGARESAELEARMEMRRERTARRELVTRLLATGVTSLTELGGVVLDADAGARRVHACWLLGQLALDDGVATLVAALRDRDPDLRDAAVHALAAYGSDAESAAGVAAVAALVETMRTDPIEAQRHAAVWALGQLKLPSGLAPLIAALREAEPTLRASVAIALGYYGRAEDAPAVLAAVPALVEAMRTGPDKRVRESAAWTLGEIRSPLTAAPLLAVLADSAEAANVRGQAAESLGSLGDPAVVPALLVALVDPAPEVRYYAAFALAQVADATVLPALQHMAEHDDAELPKCGTLRQEALDAIATIRWRLDHP